ncbi:MAG: DedA family protein [Alphaproteobacteria bacterium]|nr:DedA family protein [Alphaproteobacteria bacterium]
MDWLLDIFCGLGVWCSNLFTPAFWMEMLRTHKYAIVIGGALLEGEMVLILAGAVAYHGYMALPLVMLISFVGATIHDIILFFVGRFLGSKILNHPFRWQKKIQRIATLIHKYDHYFIMSFRFIYGIRTITPILVGSGSINFKRYFSLIIISAAIWAIAVSYIGYSFAMGLEAILAHFDTVKKYLAMGVILIVGGIYLFMRRRKRS